MSISPFPARRPSTPETEGRRARLVVLLATLGIAASLLAYAISPTVRHAVGHAAHSVKHAVGTVLDRDRKAAPKKQTKTGTKTVTRSHSKGAGTTKTIGRSAPAPSGAGAGTPAP